MIEDDIRTIIADFNERAKTDEKLKEELMGFERTVLIKIDGVHNFHFKVSDGQAGELQIGPFENAEIVIESDTETLEKLFKKELRIMKAYATKKLKIKAKLEDMLRLRKFF